MAQELPDPHWDDVRLFLAVVRAGSMTAAAGVVGANASTVHRRLGRLEAALDARLFDREPTGLTPTAAGEAMVPLAERMEAAALELVRVVAGHDARPTGPVRLTAPESLLPLLIEPLAGCRAAFPGIDLTVRFSDRFFDLGRREADIALRPSPSPPEDAVGRRIAAVGWAVYRGRETSGRAPWATYTEDLERLGAQRWWRARHGQEAVAMSVNSVPAMREVLAGAGCRGLLPCFVGDAHPGLVRETGPLPEAESALWLLTHADLRRAARIRALLDALWEALRPHRARFEGTSADESGRSGATDAPRREG